MPTPTSALAAKALDDAGAIRWMYLFLNIAANGLNFVRPSLSLVLSLWLDAPLTSAPSRVAVLVPPDDPRPAQALCPLALVQVGVQGAAQARPGRRQARRGAGEEGQGRVRERESARGAERNLRRRRRRRGATARAGQERQVVYGMPSYISSHIPSSCSLRKGAGRCVCAGLERGARFVRGELVAAESGLVVGLDWRAELRLRRQLSARLRRQGAEPFWSSNVCWSSSRRRRPDEAARSRFRSSPLTATLAISDSPSLRAGRCSLPSPCPSPPASTAPSSSLASLAVERSASARLGHPYPRHAPARLCAAAHTGRGSPPSSSPTRARRLGEQEQQALAEGARECARPPSRRMPRGGEL